MTHKKSVTVCCLPVHIFCATFLMKTVENNGENLKNVKNVKSVTRKRKKNFLHAVILITPSNTPDSRCVIFIESHNKTEATPSVSCASPN